MSAAELSGGAVLSAEVRRGPQSRSYSGPSHLIASPTVAPCPFMNTPSGAKYSLRPVCGTRFLRSNSHQGIRPLAKIEPPALAALQIREIEDRAAWVMQRPARSDPVEIVERLAVARQEEMVAVVDDEAERRIEVGPAAAAREGRRLMHDDLGSRIDEAHGGAEARDPRADDMNGPPAHGMP